MADKAIKGSEGAKGGDSIAGSVTAALQDCVHDANKSLCQTIRGDYKKPDAVAQHELNEGVKNPPYSKQALEASATAAALVKPEHTAATPEVALGNMEQGLKVPGGLNQVHNDQKAEKKKAA